MSCLRCKNIMFMRHDIRTPDSVDYTGVSYVGTPLQYFIDCSDSALVLAWIASL